MIRVPGALAEPEWLSGHLRSPGLRVLDGSYRHHEGVDAHRDYVARHIPGALFFDIDTVADSGSDLPHMLPSPERFEEAAGNMGIGVDTAVVVYDQLGLYSAPRVWWTFRVFGHENVAVLDGGLPRWLREGRETETGPVAVKPRRFEARFCPHLVRTREQIQANLESHLEQVLDARGAGRFAATDPELWPGRRRGHIPASLNLPHQDLVDPRAGAMLGEEELVERFRAAHVDLARPVVATCGSGVTAAVLLLGLHRVGHARLALYDGSWAEWGLPGDAPVETGPPRAAEHPKP